ncbi:hypothetical protein ACEQPO_11320 [Bacillus sp. SL00103]
MIDGNQIDGTTKHGIHVSDVKHFVIHDNNMENIGHHGVLITLKDTGKSSPQYRTRNQGTACGSRKEVAIMYRLMITR